MKNEITYNTWNFSYLKKLLAGYMGHGRNSIFSDFVQFASKLERLGFTYCKCGVILINQKVVNKC